MGKFFDIVLQFVDYLAHRGYRIDFIVIVPLLLLRILLCLWMWVFVVVVVVFWWLPASSC